MSRQKLRNLEVDFSSWSDDWLGCFAVLELERERRCRFQVTRYAAEYSSDELKNQTVFDYRQSLGLDSTITQHRKR